MIKLIFLLFALSIMSLEASDYGHGSGYHYSTTIYHPASYSYEPSYHHEPYEKSYDHGSYKNKYHQYGYGYKAGYSTVYNVRHYPKYQHYPSYPTYSYHRPSYGYNQPSYDHHDYGQRGYYK